MKENFEKQNVEAPSLSAEQQEQYKQWMKDNPETVIAPENLRECGPEDASNYPLRESAKIALIPIVAMLNKLKEETNITPEKLKELEAKYRYLSRAVGIINGNKVDHTR